MQEAMQILHQLKQLMATFSPAIVQMVISAIIILIYISFESSYCAFCLPHYSGQRIKR